MRVRGWADDGQGVSDLVDRKRNHVSTNTVILFTAEDAEEQRYAED